MKEQMKFKRITSEIIKLRRINEEGRSEPKLVINE